MGEFERNLFLFIIVFFVVFLFYGGSGFFLSYFICLLFLFYFMCCGIFCFGGILCMFCVQQMHIDALFCYCYHMFLCIVFGFYFSFPLVFVDHKLGSSYFVVYVHKDTIIFRSYLC